MNLKSKTIYLRLVEESDAEFILSLRINENLNKYLSRTSSSIQAQQEWIKKYKTRESIRSEFYFIICRNDNNQKIGTVRIYDFKHQEKSFCWGSWLLSDNKTRYAAIESALLVYHFAFDSLNFERSHFDVRKENEKVISFHKKLGAKVVAETESDYFFQIEKNDVHISRARLSRFI